MKDSVKREIIQLAAIYGKLIWGLLALPAVTLAALCYFLSDLMDAERRLP